MTKKYNCNEKNVSINNWLAIILIVFLCLLTLLLSLHGISTVGRVAADRTDSASVVLPDACDTSSAVWTGRYAFVFGGYNGSVIGSQPAFSNHIMRYDPVTDTAVFMNAVMPAGRGGTSAVWNGTHAFIFGGQFNSTAYINKILRYDPVADNITVMNATLPNPRGFTSAVWTGRYAYIFGGKNATSYFNDVLRYDPANDTIDVMGGTMPAARLGSGAVWDGTYAYILGGRNDTMLFRRILRYDPGLDTVTPTSSDLPHWIVDLPAVWDGTYAYTFGGFNGTECLDMIFRYHPATGNVTVMNARLPGVRYAACAVWADNAAYVFGGRIHNTDTFYNQIVKFDPPILQPVNLTPQNNSFIRDRQPVFSWQNPNTHPSDSFQLIIDNDSSFVSPDFDSGIVNSSSTSWQPSYTLPDGIWYWKVRVCEQNRWSVYSTSSTLCIDNSAPDLSITSLQNGSTLNKTTITVTGTTSDNRGLAKVEISNGSSDWIICDGTTSWSGTLNISEGENTIYAKATDVAGNSATVNISVTVVLPDTILPEISITSPQNGSTLNKTTITVTGTASDNKALAKVEISNDSSSWILCAGTASWSGTLNLSEGNNTIYARATDTAGNVETKNIRVTVKVEISQQPSEKRISTFLVMLIFVVVIVVAIAIIFYIRSKK